MRERAGRPRIYVVRGAEAALDLPIQYPIMCSRPLKSITLLPGAGYDALVSFPDAGSSSISTP